MKTATKYSTSDQIRRMTPVSAPAQQQAQTAALSSALEKMLTVSERVAPHCHLLGPNGERISVPATIFYLLERVAEVLASGNAVTIVQVGRDVTTQQAADLLNVSRTYLVRLLDEGKIAFRKTGKHRRLRVQDVLEYKTKRDKDRRAALRELSQMTQDFGGYDAELAK